jgi:putative DNA primase/helicase
MATRKPHDPLVDRIERGSIPIPHVCLGLFGGIQPNVVARMLRASMAGDDDDGLIPRFQLMVYPDKRDYQPVKGRPAADQREKVFKVFQALAGFDPSAKWFEHDQFRDIHYLGFDRDAQPLFDEWRANLERRLRDGSEQNVLVKHLAKYRSLAPSLALIDHLIAGIGADAEKVGPITVRSLKWAKAWCAFLEAHARRVYAMAFEGDPTSAELLASKISHPPKTPLPNPFTVRDVQSRGWTGLREQRDIRHALDLLGGFNWVKAQEAKGGRRMGQPTDLYFIHPSLPPKGEITRGKQSW